MAVAESTDSWLIIHGLQDRLELASKAGIQTAAAHRHKVSELCEACGSVAGSDLIKLSLVRWSVMLCITKWKHHLIRHYRTNQFPSAQSAGKQRYSSFLPAAKRFIGLCWSGLWSLSSGQPVSDSQWLIYHLIIWKQCDWLTWFLTWHVLNGSAAVHAMSLRQTVAAPNSKSFRSRSV